MRMYIISEDGITVINLVTKQVKTIEVEQSDAEQYGWFGDVILAVINGKLHTFACYEDDQSEDDSDKDTDDDTNSHEIWSKHTIYDVKTGDIKCRALDELPSDSFFNGCGMVYVASQERLTFCASGLKNLVVYNVVQDKWEVMNSPTCKLSEFPQRIPSMVITNNEEYAVTAYLHVKLQGSLSVYNKIELLDIANNRIITCAIKLPFEFTFGSIGRILYSFIANNAGDGTLINGYLRLWNMTDLPVDLIDLIIQFYKEQYLHFIRAESKEHWKIPILDILDNAFYSE